MLPFVLYTVFSSDSVWLMILLPPWASLSLVVERLFGCSFSTTSSLDDFSVIITLTFPTSDIWLRASVSFSSRHAA